MRASINVGLYSEPGHLESIFQGSENDTVVEKIGLGVSTNTDTTVQRETAIELVQMLRNKITGVIGEKTFPFKVIRAVNYFY